MIEVEQQVNAVRRQVGSRVIEAGEAKTVTVAVSYDSGLEDVWDAVTNPERIARWFLPVSGELRLGGRYAIEGNASGTIESCDPPNAFSATWEYGDAISWIEVRLSAESDARTRLELVHIAEEQEHWAQFGPGAVGIGWDLALLGLTLHLRSGEPVDKAAFREWEVSEDGKRFMTLAGDAWGEADIAGGAEPEKARAAAQSTIGFYTAAPEGEPAAG